MPQIRVDGERFASAHRQETFEDVLLAVEPALLAHARIVTEVRFNGVEEPAFRDAEIRARAVAESDDIEFDTASPVDLAAAALGDASRLIPAMSGAAAQLAHQLRSDAAPEAAAELAPLAEGLGLLLTLVQAAEDWAGAGGVAHAPWLAAEVQGISDAIEAMRAGQLDGDWIAVADALRYDLCPSLEAWRMHLAAERLALQGRSQDAHA